MALYVLGYPADIGGANVELFATIKLWRARGVEITIIPTWSASSRWQKKLDELGCKTLITSGKRIKLPDDSTVVSFGNYHLLDVAGRLKNCRLIYVPCMAEPSKKDLKFHEDGNLFDKYIFQSCWQYMHWAELVGDMIRCHWIPGAFDPAEFPFEPRPHKQGEPFWAGRISRPDVLKFSPFLWDAYDPVPNIRARIMGWSGAVKRHCGSIVPDYATVLEKCSESARTFYSHLHAIIHPTGKANENWPRFVLEAMASGTPIITDNSGGVCEMIDNERTGFLCDSIGQMVEAAARMEANENYRMRIAKTAREAVVELSDADTIWAQWKLLLKGC